MVGRLVSRCQNAEPIAVIYSQIRDHITPYEPTIPETTLVWSATNTSGHQGIPRCAHRCWRQLLVGTSEGLHLTFDATIQQPASGRLRVIGHRLSGRPTGRLDLILFVAATASPSAF